jgi:hypothetical protein
MQGVKVEDHMNGLKFTILGKKTHGGKYGQNQRSYVVMIDNDNHYHYLKQKMTNDVSSFTVKVDSAKLLGEQIRRNSKIVLQHEKTYVSPYTYRHNFSRMLKGCCLSIEQKATALGHCTDESQHRYSHSSNKNTCFKISEISGTKQIKKVLNNSYIKPAAMTAPRM